MHYVTNVEGKDPVVRAVVFDTKGASCGNLELLFYLQLAHLLEGLERNLKFLLLSHSILEVIPSLSEVPLANLQELLLNLDQLIDNAMRLANLLLEYLDLLRHILAAASI